MTECEIERLRSQFRPTPIRVLFVGEAPPVREEQFFYRGKGKSLLTKYMCDALGGPKGDIEFLNWFKGRKWYLDDLVTTSIENLGQRQKKCKEARPSLAARIEEYQPEAIVCLLRRISDDVEIAACRANSKAPLYTVTFPLNGGLTKFKDEMKRILPELPV